VLPDFFDYHFLAIYGEAQPTRREVSLPPDQLRKILFLSAQNAQYDQ